MNELDIKSGSDVLEYILEHDRSEWKDIIKRYIVNTDSDGRITLVNPNRSSINATLESFSKDYKGKYNLGDYVTTKNKGGIYRIIGLPYLDIRWKENWYNEKFIDIARIEQFGLMYTLSGIDNKGKLSGTEYYEYFSPDECSNLTIDDCSEENLIIINPGDKKEIVDKLISEIYDL